MNEANVVEREWTTRRYREGDEDQILELRGLVTGDPRSKQWWQWMCRDGPSGPAAIMLAEAKQKIIGHYAAILFPLKIGDKATKGGHGIDLMVHPDYRNQGVFTVMLKTLAATINDVSINFGTPNDQSRPGFNKHLQALEICEVPLLVKVTDWGSLLKGRYGIPVYAGKLLGFARELIIGRASPAKNAQVEIEQVASFDERIDKLWMKASKLKNIMVIKDKKYLNWRYVAKPGNEYKRLIAKRQDEIAGFIVFNFEKGSPDRGYIMDILTAPGEDAVGETLITRAVACLKADGAAMISCLMLQDTPYYRTLRKLGFMRRPGAGLCVRVFDRNIPREFVKDPGNWYYVIGDDDSM
jgi:GNAT superfamily N-acetyltransferase